MISFVSLLSALSPRILLMFSRSYLFRLLMINTAISAPRYASRLTPDTMYMPAATSVEIEIIESNNASLPDAISDSELILVPTDFTYLAEQ